MKIEFIHLQFRLISKLRKLRGELAIIELEPVISQTRPVQL